MKMKKISVIVSVRYNCRALIGCRGEGFGPYLPASLKSQLVLLNQPEEQCVFGLTTVYLPAVKSIGLLPACCFMHSMREYIHPVSYL
jgi:hypothetical protein